jgi:hypothetical protein
MSKFRLTRIEPPDSAKQPALSITVITVAEYRAITTPGTSGSSARCY